MDADTLNSLGVQSRYFQSPTAYSYPPKFNQNAYYLWLRILQSLEFETATDKWKFALQSMKSATKENNLSLWAVRRSEYDNEWVEQYLRLRRKRLVKFFDKLAVLPNQQFWKLLTKVEVSFMQSGFVIEGTMTVRDPDAKQIIQKLRALQFYPDLSKDKLPDLGYKHWRRWMPFDLKLVKVGFAVQSKRRAHFYYQIFCPRLLYTNFDQSMQKLILNMWSKLAFQFRFKGLNWTSEF